MTDAAKRAWDKVQAKFPNAVTKTPSGYIFDLNKLTPGAPEDNVGTAQAEEAPAKDFSSSEIATRRPTKKGADLTNDSTVKSDMDAINQASAANLSRMSGAGKKVKGYKEKMARTVAEYTGINYTPEDLKNPEGVEEVRQSCLGQSGISVQPDSAGDS
jgi:hypothetical protein